MSFLVSTNIHTSSESFHQTLPKKVLTNMLPVSLFFSKMLLIPTLVILVNVLNKNFPFRKNYLLEVIFFNTSKKLFEALPTIPCIFFIQDSLDICTNTLIQLL